MTGTPGPSRRAFVQAGGLALGSLALFTGCSPTARPATPEGSPSHTPPETATPSISAGPTPDIDSWAPRPVQSGRLAVTASQQGDRLTLHTIDGDRVFWAGAGLSDVIPGYLRGDFAPKAADYLRWFTQMGQLGIRVVRLDRLQAPALYGALLTHNAAHPDAPLYIVQGITISALENPGSATPIGASVRRAMSAEIADVSAAIHGDLVRAPRASGPSGRWSADVSRYVAAWIIGSTWDAGQILAMNRQSRPKPFKGAFFASTTDASATETWIAARMNELAVHEAKRGTCAPIAAANDAATDPLAHPAEPVKRDDLAGIDVNNISVLTAWPAGTFAAYRAYPYTPKFLRYQSSYQGGDPYRAYLLDLKNHHRGLPLMVTEFGIPASLGQSDVGAAERTGGFRSEQQAMKLNADMLRMFRDIGLAGGLLTSWNDDWSAVSPPTEPRSRLIGQGRRAMWHDPLSSNQWLGLLAQDPTRAGEKVVHDRPDAEMTRVTVDQDASYLYLTFFFTRRVTSPVDVGFNLYDTSGLRLPGGSGQAYYDVALHLVPTMSTVTMFVRRTLDPVRLDGLPTLYLPRANLRGWVVEQLTMSPPLALAGSTTPAPAEMQKVGELVLGSWDPTDPAFSSLATWQLVRPDPTKPMEWRLRLPWSMLTFADPSQRRGLVPDLGEPTVQPVTGMDVMIESSTPGSPAEFRVEFTGWNKAPKTTERLKAGSDVLKDALADSTRADVG